MSMTHTPEPNRVSREGEDLRKPFSLETRMSLATGSEGDGGDCSCHAAGGSEVWQEHDPLCAYRVICEASDALAQLQADLEAARAERDDFRGRLAEMCGKLMIAEAELATLRAERDEARAANDFMRKVQEAVVARWREAAILAGAGDLRRLQRLLAASQMNINGSASEAGDAQ